MFRRLNPRERWVVGIGAALSIVAVSMVYVVGPQVRRWSDREALIDLRAEQTARVESILDAQDSIRKQLDELRRARARVERELLEGETVAVAASNLQLLLNGYVTEAGMVLQRVDALGDAVDLGRLQRIPARITVRGDVRAFVRLLARIHESGPFLAVDELRVSTTATAPGQSESLTALISVHGYAEATEVAP